MNSAEVCQLCEQPAHSAAERTAWRCHHCGLIQVSDPDLATGPATLPFQQREHVQKKADLAFARLKSLLPQETRKPRMLHIDCQLGQVMCVAQQRGWQAVGVDQRRKAVELCRARKLDVYHASADRLPFESESFHVVYAADVIDRVPDARRALKEWKRVLRPGGLLMATVTETAVAAEGSELPQLRHGRTYGLTTDTLNRFVTGAGLDSVEPPPLGDLSNSTVRAAIQGTLERANRWFKRVSKNEPLELEMFARRPMRQAAIKSQSGRSYRAA